jgi:hypothetical protein
MAIGTIFTLFVVPSVYVLVARDHRASAEKLPEGEELSPQRASA